MQNLQPFIDSLQNFAQKRLGFKDPPKLFLKQDEENAKDVFGKTAFYDPNEKSITIFTTGRHPKDILRSIAHELVHHCQNLRGDLSSEKCGDMGVGYAQQNDHMREMEREAYEKGNLCFRDWEDGIKVAMQQENNQLKENKKVVKISKKELKSIIGKLVEARLQEQKSAKDLEKEIADKQERVDNITGESDPEKRRKSALTRNIAALKKQLAAAKKEQNSQTATGQEIKKEAVSFVGVKDDVGELEEGGCVPKRDEDELEEGKYPPPGKDGCCGVDNCGHKKKEGLEEDKGKKKECPHCDKGEARSKCICGKIKENEELEEAEMTAKQKKFAALAPPEDEITYADKIAGATKNESKIQTPEQEKRLYESRFNKRNEEIFDKLKKLWTK